MAIVKFYLAAILLTQMLVQSSAFFQSAKSLSKFRVRNLQSVTTQGYQEGNLYSPFDIK